MSKRFTPPQKAPEEKPPKIASINEVIEPARSPKTLSFDCVAVTQAKYTLAVFAINAAELWKIVTINKREPDKDKGYQRVLSDGRVGAISRYVKNGNCLPTSVLVTFDEGKFNKEKNKVIIPNDPLAGWIIDGQHRLAGIRASGIDIQVSVVAFLGLSEKEQITQFVKINREAKNVPASLYIDLLKHLPDKTEAELTKERSADIAGELHKDEDSPFYGKIARLGTPKAGQISLVNFDRRVSPLIARPKGKLALYSLPFQIGLLKNYYKALSHVFPDTYNPKEGVSVFFKTLGFGAVMTALPTIFDVCLKEHQGFRVEDLVNTFKRIDDFDFENWAGIGTGSDAEKLAGDDLVEKLLDRTGDGNNAGGFDLPL